MKHFLLPVLMIFLGGCASAPSWEEEKNPDKIMDLMALPMPEGQKQAVVDGSLFNVSYSNSLYEDRMAYRVGDILTVLLKENTKSNTKSNTGYKKNNSLGMPAPTIFGDLGRATSLSMDRKFDGGGSSSQENMLNGSITVSVLKVLPNRTLLVRGEKWLTLNQGDNYIRVSGILRPEDIARDNTVSSQRLANARLVFSGSGPLADSNEIGWLMRFFNSPYTPL